MEEFLQKFISNFGVRKIKYLLAEREFMNKEWLNFLIDNNLKFAIPLKMEHTIRLEKGLKTLSIEKILSDVKALGSYILKMLYKSLEVKTSPTSPELTIAIFYLMPIVSRFC